MHEQKILHNLSLVNKHFQKSPCRSSSREIPVADDAVKTQMEHQKHLEILKEKLNRPLKVVIMGEVKAGKSTLVNALVGREVTPVDVLEATSVIMEISYGQEEEAFLIRDGITEWQGSIDECYAILNGKRNDQEFAQGLTVRLLMNLPSLKEYSIVDTPGLHTITGQNAKRSEDYILESDVVLWVMNSNHLGQSDITQTMSTIAKLGKPMVGVLNKIDQVSGDRNRLLRYAQRSFGIYLRQIFALTAGQAFEGITSGDKKLLQESGMLELTGYMASEIERNVDEVLLETVQSELAALLRSNMLMHQVVARRVAFCEEQINAYAQQIKEHSQDIQTQMTKMLEGEVRYGLFADELRAAHQIINSQGFFEGRTDVSQLFSKERLEAWYKGLLQRANDKLSELWSDADRNARMMVQTSLHEYQVSEQQWAISSLDESGPSSAGSDAIRGAAIGGSFGLGLAAYSAALGPYATYIGFGAALSSIVPPLALIGAFTLLANRLVNFGQQKAQQLAELEKRIEELRGKMQHEWVDSTLMPRIRQECARMEELLIEEFQQQLAGNWTAKELQVLQLELEEYVDELKLHMEKNSHN